MDQQTLGDKDVLNQYGRMRDVQANMVGLLTFQFGHQSLYTNLTLIITQNWCISKISNFSQ